MRRLVAHLCALLVVCALLAAATPANAGRQERPPSPAHGQRVEMSCGTCEKQIDGPYVEALGQTFHPDHFTCQSCQKPFEQSSNFYEKQGQVYCLTCYEATLASCTKCGKQIKGEYYEGTASLLCPACYEASREWCSICAQPIEGAYQVNAWGEKSCAEHSQELTKCLNCNRLISERLTGGGVEFPDGRAQCNLCRESAVDEVAAARRIMEEVQRFMEREGFDLRGIDIPLELVSADELPTDLPGTDGQVRGLTTAEQKVLNDQIVESTVDIKILYGLPAGEFAAVAAHELTHVWIAMNVYPMMELVDAEGLCGMMSYVWLSQQPDKHSRFYREHMLNNENEIYGIGLQRAVAALERLTAREVADYVRENGALPTGY